MNKTVLKIGFGLVAMSACLFGATYVFNHVNPWAGIGLTVVGVIILASIIVNLIIKNEK